MTPGICGVDEAGRGPVIGPMVVAGFYTEDLEEIKPFSLRDSKRYTPKQRERLYEKIKSIGKHELIIVPAQDIDLLRKDITMNQMEVNLFARIIDALEPDIAYVDAADVNEDRFSQEIGSKLTKKVRIIARHGGDDIYPVVSAASIIAKVTRDREIERIQEEIGRNFGSGYPSDTTTIDFLKDWVAEHGELPPHTRASWKTAENVLNESKVRSLDQFGGK